jgi:plasmid stabilization system protein ParE
MQMNHKKLNVKWEKQALDRHEEWAFQIAIAYSFTHAQTYLAEIASAEEKISAHPQIGTDFPSPRRGLKRFVTPSGYSVFYLFDAVTEPTEAIIVSIIRGQEMVP